MNWDPGPVMRVVRARGKLVREWSHSRTVLCNRARRKTLINLGMRTLTEHEIASSNSFCLIKSDENTSTSIHFPSSRVAPHAINGHHGFFGRTNEMFSGNQFVPLIS